MRKAKDTKTFEQAVERLEEIVKSLESGKAGLDETLRLYEEGIALVRECNEKLDGAEQKIRTLTAQKAE